MTRHAVVSIPGGKGFIACVFLGDSEKSERAWVCVHNSQLPARRAWLGCWSYEAGINTELLRGLILGIASEIAKHSKIGPMGPFFGETYFFDGWQSWGIGIPAPLISVTPAECIADVGSRTSIDELSI
jgi:hypothetical protein